MHSFDMHNYLDFTGKFKSVLKAWPISLKPAEKLAEKSHYFVKIYIRLIKINECLILLI